MPKHSPGQRAPLRGAPPSGIFGPEWFKWRGATLAVELEGEPPFTARLDDVQTSLKDSAIGMTRPPKAATLTLLDASGRPTEVRTVPWPPPGTVRVVRMS